ncbi:cysteine desulfurase [Leifsonia sp. Leaf325]|nr:cysteine desulfurase family protein [Leifsonia sp. Leaf325]KQQ94488.1 cysteine desulfurase [Leifsonia sp. Leaf325]
MIYLDNAATTPVRREAIEAMWPYLTGSFGNPSSVHGLGESAARGLREARAEVARIVGGRAGDVVFTSGGTEADNLAIKGIALATPRGRHIITTPIEHEAVLESVAFLERVHGFEVTVLPVDSAGIVSVDDLAGAIRDDTTLVSIQYANNEIGTVQSLPELAAVAAARGIPVHTDAVQAAGWLPLGIDDLGVDALSLAGHKIGAPKGIGALVVRGRIPLEPVLHGGGQERERRSGTENVAGAVAFATALRLAESERADAAARVSALRDDFIAAVLASIPTARLTGDATHRLPGTASFVFPGTSGEAVLLQLEQRDVVCSSGSACAAGSDEASHVLLALGLDAEVAQTAVRFTLASTTTPDDLATAATATAQAVDAVSGIRN